MNQRLTKKALLKEYSREIERLRLELAAQREKNGVYLPTDLYERMQIQINAQDNSLSEFETLLKNKEVGLLSRRAAGLIS